MALTARQLEIGASIPAISKTIGYEMSRAIAGPAENFHTNKEIANQRGFREAVIAGPHLMCIISESLTRALGDGWLEGGRIKINYINSVLAGDRVTVNAKVTEKTPEGDRIRVHFEVSCENQDGTKTSVGTASGLVSPT